MINTKNDFNLNMFRSNTLLEKENLVGILLPIDQKRDFNFMEPVEYKWQQIKNTILSNIRSNISRVEIVKVLQIK